MSTNTTGPAELRRIADALDEQSAVFSSAGWIVITNTTDVRQQAAAWDADRAEVARLTAALSECQAALYGARELIGNIGNIGHAIELAEITLRQLAPAGGEAK